jgi:hypothetical protein
MAVLPFPFTPGPVEPSHPETLNGNLRNLPAALAPLVAQRRWIVWRWEFDQTREKWTKVPYRADAPTRHASSSAPFTWCAHLAAVNAFERGQGDGIGFMLKDSEFAAFDIDDSRNPTTGEIDPIAMALVGESLSYAEITVSGTGLRIIGRASGEHVHRKQAVPDSVVSIESYRKATRYIVVTGLQVGISDLSSIDVLIDHVVADLDAPKVESAKPRTNGHIERRDDLPAELDDLVRFGARVGDRSEQFHHAVGWLKNLGWTASQIEGLLASHPDGIAAKYIKRIGREVARCYAKTNDEIARPYEHRAPDPVAAESQKNLAAIARAEVPPEAELPAEIETFEEVGLEGRLGLSQLSELEFGADPLTPQALGGTLGWVAEEILAMSQRPTPAYATIGAVMFGTMLFGRAWRGFTNSSLNLFAVIAGRSGQGKSSPVNGVRLLAAECGLSARIGGRQPASDSAVEKRLTAAPTLMYCVDEIGKMFERLGSSKAQNHERKIIDLLLELWGQGTMPWSGKDAASQEADRGQQIIWFPTLSLFGATTVEQFFRAMTEANVKEGLFARLLVVSVNDRPVEPDDVADDFSDDLRSAVNDAWAASLERHAGRGNVGYLPTGARPHVEKVEATAEAIIAKQQIERWANVVSEDDEEVNGIANRAMEMTVRLASMRAISRNPKAPIAGLEDMQWAWTIMRRSLAVITYGITRHMAASEFEAVKKAMLRAIEKAGRGGLQRWRLLRASGVRQANERDQKGAIANLLDAKEIAEVSEPQDGRGRPTLRYRIYSEN